MREKEEKQKRKKTIQMVQGQLHPERMGAWVREDSVHFSVEAKGAEAPVLLIYTKQSAKPAAEIPFPAENRFGDVYAMNVSGIDPSSHLYAFRSGKTVFCDPYARAAAGRERYGDPAHLTAPLRGRFPDGEFDWEGDRPLERDFSEMVLYHLHIRGFTAHPSSRVKGKGTFYGAVQKIPYLKELGITAVELMPVTEFEEVETVSAAGPSGDVREEKPTGRLNYWGYGPSFLFAPKASYHSGLQGQSQENELKYLVKSFHQNGIEVIFDLYFPPDISDSHVLEALKFWVLEYHADGIHITGRSSFPAAAREPLLAATKLFASDWGEAGRGSRRHLAQYHDGFLADMRCFLKGDEDRLKDVVFRTRLNPENMGVVNYMAHSNGFTLWDMVSYDRKHNEDNGEGNRDGTDYNFSWNCGEEGPSRKKYILNLRKAQLRNGAAMVFLSQGVPLLEAGDETGHSKHGNNNTFCQDNSLSWLNWKFTKTGEEIRRYIRFLIHFRMRHSIFRPSVPLRGMDYKNLGYPDISVHGTNPWKPEFENYRRQIAFLYNGAYGEPAEPHLFYVMYNMHWTDQEFALPHLPEGEEWSLILHTTKEAPNYYEEEEAYALEDQERIPVPARTVILLMSRKKRAADGEQEAAAEVSGETPEKEAAAEEPGEEEKKE